MEKYVPLVLNRQAKFNFSIEKKFIAGIALKGFEVKSIRNGNVSLANSYVHTDGQEAWAINMTMSVGPRESYNRRHKLLLHKNEIKQLFAQKQKGRQIIILSIGTQGRFIKTELATAVSKKKRDKRETIKKRIAKREAAKRMKRSR